MNDNSPSEVIRASIAAVQKIREGSLRDPLLCNAIHQVKQFQSDRFRSTYFDLLASDTFKVAANFFLTDLYGDKDYASRDHQFSRISGALQRVFPDSVVATAVRLAQLHRLTEELDFRMALEWTKQSPSLRCAEKYARAWHMVGCRSERNQQLIFVMEMGSDLQKLTAKPGLRMMLRMMRKPAKVAGLTELQEFLESGFDTFSEISKTSGATEKFMQTIHTRESRWIEILFSDQEDQIIEELQS